MKFEELKPNFLEMDFDERMQFIIQYTEKRAESLNKRVIVMNTKKAGKCNTKKKDQKVSVTQEQLQLLQSLGLV